MPAGLGGILTGLNSGAFATTRRQHDESVEARAEQTHQRSICRCR
jgi:hypothetical protein